MEVSLTSEGTPSLIPLNIVNGTLLSVRSFVNLIIKKSEKGGGRESEVRDEEKGEMKEEGEKEGESKKEGEKEEEKGEEVAWTVAVGEFGLLSVMQVSNGSLFP